MAAIRVANFQDILYFHFDKNEIANGIRYDSNNNKLPFLLGTFVPVELDDDREAAESEESVFDICFPWNTEVSTFSGFSFNTIPVSS